MFSMLPVSYDVGIIISRHKKREQRPTATFLCGIGTVMDASEIINFFTSPTMPGSPSRVAHMTLSGNQPPWQSSGLVAKKDQSYSLFADGLICWSERYPELHGGPEFHLWARVDGGRAVNLSAASGTFKADASGEIELGIYMGMWGDEYGNLATDESLYASLRGSIEAVIVLHGSDPAHEISGRRAQSDMPRLVATELRRLKNPYQTPTGWMYLHEAGYSTMFREGTAEANPEIHVSAESDQGILRRAVDFELSQSTHIEWTWRVDEHPSLAREDKAKTHDYISVAAEFDNGRDLTWIWSSCLDHGYHFECPVRAWSKRETHYVVRSQGDEIGKWYSERRNIFDDVKESMGPPPAKITAVWLIALSTFQHRTARARFTDIKLANNERLVQVL